MKPIEISIYINVGGMISYLRAVTKGYYIFGKSFIFDNVETLIKLIELSNWFTITKKASSFKNLKSFKKKLEEKREKYDGDETKITADEDLAQELFNIMDKLTEVLLSEASTIYVYLLNEKRIPVKNLLDNIQICFAKDVFNALTDNIQYDIKESGKCIATECSTAGAFHVLRSLEALLKLLLQNLDPSINLSALTGWYDIINKIRSYNISDLDVLCDNCDRIRANYRNPTNHPEKIYNIEEVQDLFNLCVGVINDLVGYMKNQGYL